MIFRLPLLALLTSVGLASCHGGTSTTESPTADSLTDVCCDPAYEETSLTGDTLLRGRTYLLDYGEMRAEVTYGLDTLHWKTFTPAGEPTGQADELPAYERLGKHYLVSWMEADGTAVQQILDLQAGTVQACLFTPSTPTSLRPPVYLTGTVKLLR